MASKITQVLRIFIFLFSGLFPLASFGQADVIFQYNNHPKFLDGADTIPFPFAGGLIAPQFSRIDLDGDGLKDMFVFDRFGNKALTFLARSESGIIKYNYAPQYEAAFPPLFNWVFLIDMNCDGKEDILTEVDQTASFVNTSGVRMFRNVTGADKKVKFEILTNQFYAISPGNTPVNIYVPSYDIPAFSDIDNDGDIDLLAYGVLGGQIEVYKNMRIEKGYSCDSIIFQYDDPCWGSFIEGSTVNYPSFGQPCYRLSKKSNVHSGATSLVIDLDADGDKDLLSGNISFSNIIKMINGKNDLSYIRDTMIAADTVYPSALNRAQVPFFPASYYVDVNNDGKRDLIVAPNTRDQGKNLNQILYFENTGADNNPNFVLQQNDFIQDRLLDLGSGTIPSFFDYDGDGITDLILATHGDYDITKNTQDRLLLYKNAGSNSQPVYSKINDNYLGLTSLNLRDIAPSFGDLNGDGKLDLLFGDYNGKLHYYQNNAAGSTADFQLVSHDYSGIDAGTSASPQIIDLDHDGKNDLVIGELRGNLNYYRNTGSATNPTYQLITDSLGQIHVNDFVYTYNFNDTTGEMEDSSVLYLNTGYSAPHFTDLNNDGKWELIVGANSGRVHFFSNIENNLSGKFTELNNKFADTYNNSLWNADLGERVYPVAIDLDGDGAKDLMIGNYRGGLNYFKSMPGQGFLIEKLRSEFNFELIPNPSNQRVTISITGNKKAEKLSITDIRGRIILEHSLNAAELNYSLETGNLPNGVYFVTLENNSGYKESRKLVVVH